MKVKSNSHSGINTTKKSQKEKAEFVSIEYYDQGTLSWSGNAVVYRHEPETKTDYESGSIDCVDIECQTDGSPWNGKASSIRIYFSDRDRNLILRPHTEPMCEHIWYIMKIEVDAALDEARKYEDIAKPSTGTTQKIG